MKSWLSTTLTALALLLAFTADAQEDCDCPPGDAVEYCALNFLTGEFGTVVGTECELACEGWLILGEGPCDDIGDPVDCDCDYTDYSPVCVTLDDGQLCTFYNACEAECFGYTDYTEGECEYTVDCDCPEDEPVADYCVLNLWTGEQENVTGSECELFCEGFLILSEGACEDLPEPCDCDWSIYEPVCVTTDSGEQITFYNACEAECLGFTDWTEGECEFIFECDCPEDEPVLDYCVINLWTGEQENVTGTECELWCEGFIILNEGPCMDDPAGCDCDWNVYEPVCVTTDSGDLLSFFNACEAECWGYTEYTEGECEYPDPCDDCPEDEPVLEYCGLNFYTGEYGSVTGQECQLYCEGWLLLNEGPCEEVPDPCDCPEEEPGIYCVSDWWGSEIWTMEATICEIECQGLFIVADGACEDIPDPCADCPEEEPALYCVGNWWTDEIFVIEGTVCELECEGYIILGEGECVDIPDPCDCPEDEWGVFCVVTWWSDEVFVMEGNPCELECEGFFIIGEGNCEDTPGDGCGCPEDEPVGIYCALNTWTGEIETVEGQECQLFCDGYFILEDGTCDDIGDPSGCDCPEDEPLEVFCIYDPFTGGSYEVESTACLLECEGIWFYEAGPCDEEDPIDPCGCPDDEEADEYCVINLWTGDIEVVYGTECELFCEGLIIIGYGDCEDPGTGEGDPADCDCPEEEVIDFCVLDFTTGETIQITSTACQLVCDGYFIFWEGSCDGGFGDDDGGNTLEALEDWSEEILIEDLMMFPIPADDLVNISVKTGAESVVNVEVFNITGQRLQATQWTLNGGTEIRELDLSGLASGMYTVSLTDAEGRRTSGQIVKR